MSPIPPVLEVRFYASKQGREPARDWLKSFKTPGDDLKLALRRAMEVHHG